ncbi:MAG TPA: serine/threonine-protein kinase, partial [Polyangiaceae bacterium]|nr:serine/threonine-protein kinase [Polyangiaceae bacterium]
IHRDLKPANIFLVEHGDEADFVKVLDFGLVKVADSKGEDLTQTGMFMGSPKYMSPEQIRGDRIDARADVYALGIILYEMLTGKVPFDRPNSVNILMAHVAEDAPAMLETNPHIQVPPELEETVLRCMAKDPDRRFRSMDEVLLALKRVSAGLPVAPITGLEPTERAPLSGSGGSRPGKATARASSPGPTPGAASARAQAPHSSMRALMPSDSPVGGSPLVLHAPARAGSKGMLVAAVGAALALAGVIGLFAIRPPEPAVVVARQQPSPGVGASAVSPGAGAGAAAGAGAGAGAVTVGLARAPSAQPAEPAPLLVTVHVMSDPDGAAVKEDGVEVCGATPCDVTYRGSDADPAREHRLTISHTGFRTETRTIKASDAALTVKLSALPRAAPPPPTRTEAPPAVPTGYKTDIPY